MLEGMSKSHLAHEMCLDPTFQFLHPKDPFHPTLLVRTCIRQVHPDEFWRVLPSKLMLAASHSGVEADYGDLLGLLGYIKDGVKSLVPASRVGLGIVVCMPRLNAMLMMSCQPFHPQDASRIDTIKQKIEPMDTKGFTNILDWIIDGMCNVLDMEQSIPRRDETRAMWEASKQELVALDAAANSNTAIQCMCDALKLVVDRIERMRLDKANKQLRVISPSIRANGMKHLQESFDQELMSGTLTLEFTKELMVHTVDMLRQGDADAIGGSSEGGLQMMDARKETIDAANNIGEVFRGIIVAGVIDTIDTFPNWGGKDRSAIAREGTNDERVFFPEVFRFDLKRVQAMQRSLRHDVACTVILSQVGFVSLFSLIILLACF